MKYCDCCSKNVETSTGITNSEWCIECGSESLLPCNEEENLEAEAEAHKSTAGVLRGQIEKLEAENKRLREALLRLTGFCGNAAFDRAVAFGKEALSTPKARS